MWRTPDPLGKPSLVYTTTISRDDNGNATQVTQANGVVTDYGYDALDRLSSMTTHPASGVNLVTSVRPPLNRSISSVVPGSFDRTE